MNMIWFLENQLNPDFCYNYDTYGNSHTYGNYNSGRNFNGGSNATKNPPDYGDYDYGYSRESHLNVHLTNFHFDYTENKTKSSKILYIFSTSSKNSVIPYSSAYYDNYDSKPFQTSSYSDSRAVFLLHFKYQKILH